MWLNLASIIFVVFLVSYLLWSLANKPYDAYKLIIVSSLCFSPLILFGNYPIADEIAFTVIAGFLFFKFIRKRQEIFFTRNDYQISIRIIVISYFILNTLLSILFEFDVSKLRFLNIFVSLFILTAALEIWKTKSIRINSVVRKALYVNLFIWISYYVILRVFGIDWNYQQAVTYVGSTYAAFVPAIGLVMLLLFEQNTKVRNLSFGYLTYYAGSVVASQIYYSRVLEFAVVVTTLLAIIIKRNIIATVTVILVFMGSFSISGPAITLQDSNPSVVDMAKRTKSSINFIAKPRASDFDRSQQIRCSTKLIVFNEKFLVMLFGYGQNNHKTALKACTEAKSGPVETGQIVRPVGYAAIITDFGLVGLGLLLVLFALTFIRIRHEKGSLLYSVMLLQIASWSLVTNFLDHEAIFLILLMNLFGAMAREFRENSTS